MATTNPNELSNAEYWARVGGQPVQTPMMIPPELRYQPQNTGGLGTIFGGQTNWNGTASPWLQDLAAGIAVQQNGYDATAAMPVAAGPAWAGPSPIPAYPRSGANVTMPGSREAWERYGVPPVVIQPSPYATAAYRTYTDPYGQIGVQPLTGFPSVYPHVLSGVPGSLYRHIGEFAQALPYTPLMHIMAMGMMPQMPAQPRQQARTVSQRSQRSQSPQVGPVPPVNTPPTPPTPPAVSGGPYDETTWRNRTMPVPPSPSLGPVMTQMPPELGGNANTSPEAFASGHAINYPGAFEVLPNGQTVPSGYVPPASFIPNWMTPEEAAETADGMYVDPNQSVLSNLLGAVGAVSIPLSAGAGGALFGAAPRVIGAAPQGALPYAAAGALP